MIFNGSLKLVLAHVLGNRKLSLEDRNQMKRRIQMIAAFHLHASSGDFRGGSRRRGRAGEPREARTEAWGAWGGSPAVGFAAPLE